MTDGIRDTIGCDLGDKFSDLFILTANGETQVPERLKTTQAGVKKFFSQRKPAHVVLEASTHSRWVSSIVKKLGHEVVTAASGAAGVEAFKARRADFVITGVTPRKPK